MRRKRVLSNSYAKPLGCRILRSLRTTDLNASNT
jgi:hypothetical protein